MDTQEAVLLAVEWLFRRHRSDLLTSGQVTISFLPNYGHGDDIWFRTETMHVVAEVTTSAANENWSVIKGPKRQTICRKIDALHNRADATHRYLFVVGDNLAHSLQGRAGDSIEVVPLSGG